MEIRFYTREMEFIGVTENQSSLIWTRRYDTPGEFELHAPITDYNLQLMQRENLVWIKGKKDCGSIEDLEITEGSEEAEIIAKGRFTPAYMDRRLIKSTVNFSGTYEDAMYYLPTICEEIPLVEYAEPSGITDEVTFQATYKNLLDYEEKLASAAGYGFRYAPDFENQVLTFEVYQGTDRSMEQDDVPRVIFSDEYANLESVSYRVNDQCYKNVAYVGGEGEGSERTYITVALDGYEDAEGMDLRELFVDAKDISSEDLTEDEYLAELMQRGLEKLEENAFSESVECDTEPDGNFKYEDDYDIGDIVTVRKSSWGIEKSLRLTEMQEVYESEARSLVPIFGDPLPETVDWSDE